MAIFSGSNPEKSFEFPEDHHVDITGYGKFWSVIIVKLGEYLPEEGYQQFSGFLESLKEGLFTRAKASTKNCLSINGKNIKPSDGKKWLPNVTDPELSIIDERDL